MAYKKREDAAPEIVIHPVQEGHAEYYILGTSPLILNRMSQKAWHELLAPKGRKTAADKTANLKHDPIAEFRDSPYRIPEIKEPTLLAVMPSSFKKSMAIAALDTPGAKKAQIDRLVKMMEPELLPIWGVPRIFMAVTRSADQNKTPDIRTRALLPEWAAKVVVRFNATVLRTQSITNLLAAAGMWSGIGDWRQEKGSGSYGSFIIVSKDDPDFKRITTTQGRKAQQEALEHPMAYNDETAEMLAWFDVEVKRRGFSVGDDGRLVPTMQPISVTESRRRGRRIVEDEGAIAVPDEKVESVRRGAEAAGEKAELGRKRGGQSGSSQRPKTARQAAATLLGAQQPRRGRPAKGLAGNSGGER